MSESHWITRHPYNQPTAPKPPQPKRWPWIVALIVTGFVFMILGCTIGALAVEADQETRSGSTSTQDTTGATEGQPADDGPSADLVEEGLSYDDALGMIITLRVTNTGDEAEQFDVDCTYYSPDRSEVLSEGWTQTVLLEPGQAEVVDVISWESGQRDYRYECTASAS